MLNKDSAEYQLRKQKRIEHLMDEIRDIRKDVIKGSLFAIIAVSVFILRKIDLNMFVTLILSSIVVLPISYLIYKGMIFKYEVDLERLLNDDDTYFGYDDFYD